MRSLLLPLGTPLRRRSLTKADRTYVPFALAFARHSRSCIGASLGPRSRGS